jgi:hypothetical protein
MGGNISHSAIDVADPAVSRVINVVVKTNGCEIDVVGSDRKVCCEVDGTKLKVYEVDDNGDKVTPEKFSLTLT